MNLLRILILILFFGLSVNVASRAQNSPSVPADSCDCQVGGPEFPDGFRVFHDEAIAKASEKVKPVTSGTIYVRFTITENGWLVNPEVIRSVDPAFEKELLKILPLMGRWIPACDEMYNSGDIDPWEESADEEERRSLPRRKRTAVVYTAPFRIIAPGE